MINQLFTRINLVRSFFLENPIAFLINVTELKAYDLLNTIDTGRIVSLYDLPRLTKVYNAQNVSILAPSHCLR